MKVSALALLCALSKTSAFSPTLPSVYVKLPPAAPSRPSIYSAPFHSTHLCSSAASVPSPSNESESSSASGEVSLTKQQKRLKQIREEGGIFAFNTKYGALNPFGIYYGLTSIALGLVWFAGLTASQLLYKVTGDKLDKKRRIPVFLSHVWGTLLMLFTACFPKIENGKIIKDFHKR